MCHYSLLRILISYIAATFWLACMCLAGDHKDSQELLSDQPSFAAPHYVIGSGDVLTINVWKEPEASVPAAAVRPDGMISVPIVKDVQAAGLTPLELQRDLSLRFSKF